MFMLCLDCLFLILINSSYPAALCNSTEFACRTRPEVCLPLELVCDGLDDCPNGLDERQTSCPLGIGSSNGK